MNREKKLTLETLNERAVFEYVGTKLSFCQGVFMKLKQSNCYLQGQGGGCSIFILDFQTGQICCHTGRREVRLLSKPELKEQDMKSEKSMNHFINWKFGVPVKVHEINPGGVQRCVEARLISESENYFAILFGKMQIGTRNKANFCYELIPYRSINATLPRYPVCVTGIETAYCNSREIMGSLFSVDNPMEVIPEPTATLIIDGKEIELSAETAARLKKELGG